MATILSNKMDFSDCDNMVSFCKSGHIPYTENLSRGKTFTVRTKMNINRKTFMVAASFNNEISDLVNDSMKNIRG